MSEPLPTSSLDNVVVRVYTRGDLDAMFRLDEICFEQTFRFSRTDMWRLAEARKAQVLVAQHGTELAGFSIVHIERSQSDLAGYLVTLDISMEFRRRGLAGLLLSRAESDAQRAGCSVMLLHVFSGNLGAISLYEKLGYSCAGIAEDFYASGLDAYVYRKPLG